MDHYNIRPRQYEGKPPNAHVQSPQTDDGTSPNPRGSPSDQQWLLNDRGLCVPNSHPHENIYPEPTFEPFEHAPPSPRHGSINVMPSMEKVKHYPVETSKPNHRRWDYFLRFANKWWLWEMLSLLVAFGCYIAIVVVLAHADDAPVESWSSTIFTLNSLIASLSTLMRVALMVPVASAIGQQKWLWFQKQPGELRSRRLIDMELVDSASRGPWGSIVLLARRPGR